MIASACSSQKEASSLHVLHDLKRVSASCNHHIGGRCTLGQSKIYTPRHIPCKQLDQGSPHRCHLYLQAHTASVVVRLSCSCSLSFMCLSSFAICSAASSPLMDAITQQKEGVAHRRGPACQTICYAAWMAKTDSWEPLQTRCRGGKSACLGVKISGLGQLSGPSCVAACCCCQAYLLQERHQILPDKSGHRKEMHVLAA